MTSFPIGTITPSNPPLPGVVVINVGGTKFRISRERCKRTDWMFADIPEDELEVFVDRDPRFFQILLDYVQGYPLRTGMLNKYMSDMDIDKGVFYERLFMDIEFYRFNSILGHFEAILKVECPYYFAVLEAASREMREKQSNKF